MKKLVLLAGLLLPFLGIAQNKDCMFGFNIGPTLANIRGNEIAEQNKYGVQYLLGVSFEAPINDKISFVTNLNYERKGFNNEVNTSTTPGAVRMQDTKLALQYISLPINIKYYPWATRKLFLNGGVFAAYYAGYILTVDGYEVQQKDNSIFKKMDFGLNLGIGYRIPLNEENNLNIELRDNLGLADISNTPIVNGGAVKTNSVNLIITMQFKL